jgi:hypothetical protein
VGISVYGDDSDVVGPYPWFEPADQFLIGKHGVEVRSVLRSANGMRVTGKTGV